MAVVFSGSPTGAQGRDEEAYEYLGRQNRAMKRLVAAVQELSLARNPDSLMAVVCRAARELTGADGATFVLRDGDKCFYADENAIAPVGAWVRIGTITRLLTKVGLYASAGILGSA